jgi:hypothetical protein
MRRPSGLAVMPRGRLPTGTVPMTRPLVASMTVTSSDFSLVTKTRSSAAAGLASASSSSVKQAKTVTTGRL